MSNKKQNSLEWYIEETFKLSVKFERQEISQEEYTLGYSNLLQQAKAMHKEESELIFECGRNFQLTGEGTFNEVYNETFGDNNE